MCSPAPGVSFGLLGLAVSVVGGRRPLFVCAVVPCSSPRQTSGGTFSATIHQLCYCLLSANSLLVQRVLQFIANLERQKCTICVTTLEITRRALFVCNRFALSDSICNAFTQLCPAGVAKSGNGSGWFSEAFRTICFCKPGLANPQKWISKPPFY